jgi:hypothetical protein
MALRISHRPSSGERFPADPDEAETTGRRLLMMSHAPHGAVVAAHRAPEDPVGAARRVADRAFQSEHVDVPAVRRDDTLLVIDHEDRLVERVDELRENRLDPLQVEPFG